MLILQALYFMLPAYFANMAPVFASKFFGSKFSYPLDCKLKYQGQPLLGSHKTWRGLLAALVMSWLVINLQAFLFQFPIFSSLSILDYQTADLFVFGFLFGFGVILGDAVKSFFKRRQTLKPGDKWLFWDQLDFLGALILILFVYLPPWSIFLIILIISPLLPLATNWLGYKLKLKKVAW